ncbi:hypothetical protein B566_EDAN013829 [Ephemera danica]|nr:hypothetical protein B566_EDAN013829 [Ephemera danica]
MSYDKIEASPEDLHKKANESEILTEDQKCLFYNLLLKHKTIFSERPGLAKNFQNKINVKDHKPFVQHPYPVPLAYREKVRDAREVMLKWGIIERAMIRPCLDGRKINEIISPERKKPKPPGELLQMVKGSKYLSSTDLRNPFGKLH